MFPKVSSANEIIKFDKLISKLESKFNRKKNRVRNYIETTLGLINIKDIAIASNRNESLHFC